MHRVDTGHWINILWWDGKKDFTHLYSGLASSWVSRGQKGEWTNVTVTGQDHSVDALLVNLFLDDGSVSIQPSSSNHLSVDSGMKEVWEKLFYVSK